MNRLEDKVALITGASRGIGRGIALCMAREGADIVVNYRTHPDEARGVASEIENMGRRAFLVQADVSDPDAQQQMFDDAIAHFGFVDIAVANASRGNGGAVHEANLQDVRRTIEVAQLGVYYTCQLAAQQMMRQIEGGRPGGKIIIIASVQSEYAPPNTSAYSMSKAAINHLGRVMAVEMAPYHVNVNTINPGWIDTPGERDRFGDQRLDEGGSVVPWGRLGTPADIGEAAVFLASDAADYITGTSLRVDGGFVIGMRTAPIWGKTQRKD